MNWRNVSLGEIAPLQYGKGLPELKRAGGEVPVFGSNGIVGWHNSALVYNPSIIVGRKGTVGALNFSSTPCWPIDTAFYTEGSEECDIKFLHYLMKTLPLKESSDSAVPGLNRDYAHSLRVKIPDLSVQKSIAIVLDSLDEKIRINQQISKILEEIAQTIFKSWFVDFDPVHAKSRGEKPIGMDEETAGLFPDSFEDSELGPIPSGWSPESLSYNFNLISGGTPKTNIADYWNGQIPWYSVVDAPSMSPYFISTSKYITDLGVEKSSVNLVSKNTTIISARGTVGKLALAGVETTFNQSCYGIKGHHSDYFTYFLVQNSVKRLLSMTHGGTFDTITRSTFDGIQVVAVPPKMQLAFDKLVESFFSQMCILENQTATLTQIRDSLLPRLISGELEIPEELLVS